MGTHARLVKDMETTVLQDLGLKGDNLVPFAGIECHLDERSTPVVSFNCYEVLLKGSPKHLLELPSTVKVDVNLDELEDDATTLFNGDRIFPTVSDTVHSCTDETVDTIKSNSFLFESNAFGSMGKVLHTTNRDERISDIANTAFPGDDVMVKTAQLVRAIFASILEEQGLRGFSADIVHLRHHASVGKCSGVALKIGSDCVSTFLHADDDNVGVYSLATRSNLDEGNTSTCITLREDRTPADVVSQLMPFMLMAAKNLEEPSLQRKRGEGSTPG